MEQIQQIKTIRELFSFEPALFALPTGEKTAPAGPEIPIAEEVFENPPAVVAPAGESEVVEIKTSRPVARRFFFRDYVRYPLIFLVALGFFYLILNFHAVTAQLSGVFSNFKEARQEKAAPEEVPARYGEWLSKYYVYAGAKEILEPGFDADHDGLTNLQEYYLGSNPLKYDTDRDGYNDGQEVMNGYNPLYTGKLRPWQEQVVAEHVNLESINSRGAVAGDVAMLPVAGFLVDPSKPGNISIPKLGVDAAIIWSAEFSQMEQDLKYGTAHHPGTPYPGERGTSSIHGHSSGNPWDGNYKYVFTKINLLEPGDEVFVTVFGTKGEERRYRFVVRSEKVYAKDDPAQFADLGGYFLNLSTSWPVGTAYQRYVVTTELTSF